MMPRTTYRLRMMAFVATAALAACEAQESPFAPMRAANPMPMTKNIRVEDHFSGADLELARAAARGDAAEVARLVREKNANPNAISREGMPLLLWPVQAGNREGTRALLENGADPNLPLPRFGSPMVLVAMLDDPEWLRLLLDHGGDPNLQNRDGEPLARVAMLHRNWESVKLLVERGADINAGVHGFKSRSMLAYYAATGQFDKVHWLLTHGADPTVRLEAAADGANVGAPIVLEAIYWYPIDETRFPELADWQRKSQQWLRDNGIGEVPAEPDYWRRQREEAGLPKPIH